MTNFLNYLRSLIKSLQRSLSRIKFNIPHTATTAEIALIMNTNLFRKMSESELAQLVSSIQVCKYQAGEIILHEGDVDDELFVIETGSARVFITDEAGNKIQLKVLQPGNYFGEQTAASLGKLKSRNASIEAVTDLLLIKIQGKYIHKLLERDSSLKSLIDERKLNQAMNVVTHVSVFQQEIESLLSKVSNPQVLEFTNRQCIFQAGDKSDYVYLVIQGRAKLFIPQKNNDQFSELLLNKGHLFGELGVMNDVPRSATAIADGNLRLLAIDGNDFNKDVALLNGFKKKLVNLQRMYALPMRGTVEQYTQVEPDKGHSIVNVYTLEDGRVVRSANVFDKGEFAMWEDDCSKARRFEYNRGNDHVILYVKDQHLVRLEANSSYEALPELCYFLLDHVAVNENMLQQFQSSGKLLALVTS